jgi:hypothetical protein
VRMPALRPRGETRLFAFPRGLADPAVQIRREQDVNSSSLDSTTAARSGL